MRREPQRVCSPVGIEPEFLPPPGFIALTMEFAMMSPAERDCELVADFASECSILGKTQMMGIARLPSADQAGLLGHKSHVVAIANAPQFGMRQQRLVDRS